jgi:hypothetical protein
MFCSVALLFFSFSLSNHIENNLIFNIPIILNTIGTITYISLKINFEYIRWK